MSRYTFHPIADAPLDGSSLVLASDDGWQAVGHFDKGIWWLGHSDQPNALEQLDFEPTKYAQPRRQRRETPTPAETERGSVVGKEAVHRSSGTGPGTEHIKPHEDRADG